MARRTNYPVYLFTGFLDSGKTTFIQSTMEDKRFNAGEQTLLLLCEEGEEEYDLSQFSSTNVLVRKISSTDELTEERLNAFRKEIRFERIVIEYNGMWNMQLLYDSIPDEWIVAQEICFFDATVFQVYNANMRNLVFDKLQTCDLVVFNRCLPDTDTMIFHKAVRQINRRCNIIYEYADGRDEPDTIEDPMPFDLSADIVTIEDRDYAYFFSDMMENCDQYDGKVFEFKARCITEGKTRLPAGAFVAGRELMNCCAADTQFAGFLCRQAGPGVPANNSWMMVRGRIKFVSNHLRAGKVPVLDVITIRPASAPDEEVATFY